MRLWRLCPSFLPPDWSLWVRRGHGPRLEHLGGSQQRHLSGLQVRGRAMRLLTPLPYFLSEGDWRFESVSANGIGSQASACNCCLYVLFLSPKGYKAWNNAPTNLPKPSQAQTRGLCPLNQREGLSCKASDLSLWALCCALSPEPVCLLPGILSTLMQSSPPLVPMRRSVARPSTTCPSHLCS